MGKLKVKDKHLHSLLQRILQTDVENPLSTGKFAFFTILLKTDVPLCLQCFEAVGWPAGMASGL